MAYEMKMPKYGETMTEGTIFNWFKQEGDQVQKGEVLYQVETDKFSMDVEAEADGVLAKILVGENETAPIGDVVAIIADEGEEVEETAKADQDEKTIDDAAEEKSDLVEKNDQSVKSATSSANNVISDKVKASPAAKRLAAQNGLDIAQINPREGRDAVVASDVEAYLEEEKAVKATPVARKMAQEYDLDLSGIAGTGPGGQITRSDIELTINKASDKGTGGELKVETEVPLKGIRKVVAERMSSSYREAPHVTLTTKADMTEVVKMRKRIREKTEERITYTDILIMIVSRVLTEYPAINSHLKDDHLYRYDKVNMGIAVDIDKGLVVPVINDAAGLGLEALARERQTLVEKAQEGKLNPDEMTGSTFTLTNLGGFGIEIFTPIINPPEVGILGVGSIKEEPVAVDGKVEVRPVMWLSLSFDHRAVDGAPAARFLNQVKDVLEEPELLFL